MANINKTDQNDEWVFLKNTGPGYELEIITSMLDQLQIPVLKKAADQLNIPSFIMGESISDYDIYVPSSRIVEAREILDNIQPLEQEQDLPYEDTVQLEDHQPAYIPTYSQGFKKPLITLIIIAGILGLIFISFKW